MNGRVVLTYFSFLFQWVELGHKLASTFTQGKKSSLMFQQSLAGLENDPRASHLLEHASSPIVPFLDAEDVWVRRATGSSTTVYILV